MRRAAVLASLTLGGCSEESVQMAEGAGLAVLALALVFVVVLAVYPPISAYLKDRAHHRRMYHRRPFSPDEAQRSRRRPRSNGDA